MQRLLLVCIAIIAISMTPIADAMGQSSMNSSLGLTSMDMMMGTGVGIDCGSERKWVVHAGSGWYRLKIDCHSIDTSPRFDTRELLEEYIQEEERVEKLAYKIFLAFLAASFAFTFFLERRRRSRLFG